jgi:O-antigen/teichoic acid export membrane protein
LKKDLGILTVIKGATTSLGVRLSGIGISFLLHIFLARSLGKLGYGEYIYAITAVFTLVAIVTLGLDASSVRFVAEYYAQGKKALLKGFVCKSQELLFFSCAAALILLGGVLNCFSNKLDPSLVGSFSVGLFALPCYAFLRFWQETVRGLKKIFMSQAIEQLLLPLGLLLGAFFIAHFRGSLRASDVLSVQVLVLVPAILFLVSFGKRNSGVFDGDVREEYQIKVWLSVSLPLMLGVLASLLLSRIDMLFLGAMVSREEVGLYAASSKIASLLIFGLSALNAIVSPIISELYHLNELKKLQSLLSLATRWVVVCSLPLLVGMLLGGRFLLGMFGDGFEGGYSFLIILSCANAFNVAAGSIGPLLTMTGFQKYYFRVLCVICLLNLVLTPIGIVVFGPSGAALATAFSMIVWNIWLVIGARARTGVLSFVTPGPMLELARLKSLLKRV